MKKVDSSKPVAISDAFIDGVCKQLKESKQVRRSLPYWGRIHMDRPLPFLCVYRKHSKDDDWGTDRLAVTSASYLLAPASPKMHPSVSALIAHIAKIMVDRFGSFLILEIWTGPMLNHTREGNREKSLFTIIKPPGADLESTSETLQKSLQKVKVPGLPLSKEVEIRETLKIHPPKFRPLMKKKEAENIGCMFLGLEVPPIYRDPEKEQQFPIVLRQLRRGIQRSFKRTFFEFTQSRTTRAPENYQTLGRRAVVKAVWEADRKLAEVSRSFDFLLLMTPVNTERQWARFRKRDFEKAPRFSYRPLPIDTAIVKRKLFSCPIERVEDPTLALLFTQMQSELDRKLTMLSDRGSKNCLYGSLQVYGGVDDELLETAEKLLSRLPARSREGLTRGSVGAKEFAAEAKKEIERFKKSYPEITAQVEVRKDMIGLMVSRGNLLVGADLKVPKQRVRSLIQHEVGTHVLTYFNGMAQPFQLLQLGLPGYDELQEGLAVLAEFLVGGLSKARLRLLAGRVVAVRQMIDGASFVDVFETLTKTWHFEKRTAFVITMRVYRGGGLSKDAVYLKGLIRLMHYLGNAGKIEDLFIGKVDIDHVPMIRELLARRVLRSAPLKPFYLEDEQAQARLARLSDGLSIFDLTERRKK